MRFMRRIRCGLLAAAALFCGFAATAAEAGTFRVDFTGTVLGDGGGDAVKGTMVFHNIANTPTNASDDGYSASSTFSSDNITWNISVGSALVVSGIGQSAVTSYSTNWGGIGTPDAGIGFDAGISVDSNRLFLEFINTNVAAGDYHDHLVSLLSDVPTSLSGITALLGGQLDSFYGNFPRGVLMFNDGEGSIRGAEFRIETVSTAVTPIPAALPLFASALLGIGGLAWRKRKAAA